MYVIIVLAIGALALAVPPVGLPLAVYVPSAGDARGSEQFEFDVATMEIRHRESMDTIVHKQVLELARRKDGTWYHRVIYRKSSDHGQVFAEDKPDINASDLPWGRLRSDLVPWVETSYRRCLDFFDAHPGLRPDITLDEYIALAGGGGSVWRPPSHASDEQLL
jgi:hypothetical protein